jgi:signal transduction histidine kinase
VRQPTILLASSIGDVRMHSLWRDHPWLTTAAIVVALVQVGLMVGLLFEHRRRRRAELESRANLVAATQLDRRAAMGQLAGSLAHELHQPLGAILHNAATAELLLTSAVAADAVRPDLRAILAEIRQDDHRAVEIIQRIRLQLQNPQTDMQAQTVDLNRAALDAVGLVRSLALGNEVRIDLDLAEPLPTVSGDVIHLQQVLLNLLLNGLDATSAVVGDRRRVIVRTAHQDRCVQVSVVDRGIGIPRRALSRIFDPFYTTKADGLGLGLSIARGIVEAHGGRISAENNADAGATVRFTVPAPGTTRRVS